MRAEYVPKFEVCGELVTVAGEQVQCLLPPGHPETHCGLWDTEVSRRRYAVRWGSGDCIRLIVDPDVRLALVPAD